MLVYNLVIIKAMQFCTFVMQVFSNSSVFSAHGCFIVSFVQLHLPHIEYTITDTDAHTHHKNGGHTRASLHNAHCK